MAEEHVSQDQEHTTEGASLLDSMYPAETHADIKEVPNDDETAVSEGEAETSEEEETEEVELSSFDELAEHFDLDRDWLKGLKVETKVNGEVGQVSLSEMVAKYQQYQMGDVYLKEAKEKADQIVSEARQEKESIAGTVVAFSKLMENVEAEIERDVKNIDWAKLRQDDPAEHAAKKEEIRERRERLKELKQEAQKTYQEAAQKAKQQHLAALEENLPKEREMFFERVPEWRDNDKASSEREEVVKYLSNEGFGEQDIKVAAYNGRLLAMAVKAMRYDAAKAKSQAAKKKVVKVPKVLKPGSKSKEAPKTNGAAKKDPATILYG